MGEFYFKDDVVNLTNNLTQATLSFSLKQVVYVVLSKNNSQLL